MDHDDDLFLGGSCSHLKIEKSEGDVLNDFLCHVFRIEFGPELELERRLFFDILTEHLLVELQPGRVVFGVGVLQAKEPDLPETNGFDDLIKELFASRVGLDGELQLRVDGRDANIHWLRHSGECARGGVEYIRCCLSDHKKITAAISSPVMSSC